MGNLVEQTWDELWNSKKADNVRTKVRCCDRNCWMIGSVYPAMHKYFYKPFFWFIKHKFLNVFKKKKYSMFENKIFREYRDGIISKEELDRLSTCDLECVVQDGLSNASKELLKSTSGEKFVEKFIEESKNRF